MTEEALQKIIEEYRGGEEQGRRSLWEIATHLYKNPSLIAPERLDDDKKSDFLLWFLPKLNRFFSQYDKSKGSAVWYLHTIIRWSYKAYGAQRRRENERGDAVSDGAVCCLDDETFKYGRSFEVAEQNAPNVSRAFAGRASEVYKRWLLILLLKNSSRSSQEIIDGVADYTGVKKERLYAMVDEAENEVFGRKEKLKRAAELESSYYVKILALQKRLSACDKNTNPREYAELKERIGRFEERKRAARRRRLSIRVQISNRKIAELLDIPLSTVNGCLRVVRNGRTSGFLSAIRATIDA